MSKVQRPMLGVRAAGYLLDRRWNGDLGLWTLDFGHGSVWTLNAAPLDYNKRPRLLENADQLKHPLIGVSLPLGLY